MGKFVRIGSRGHSWAALVTNWQQQTQEMGEVFDEDGQLQGGLLEALVQRNDARAGLYGIKRPDGYGAICQLNTAGLPGFRKPVMRMRFLTLCPRIDLGDAPIDDYIDSLVEVFLGVVNLCSSEGPMKAGHIHFHLPSPADRRFFMLAGRNVAGIGMFKSVEARGAWLYITL